MLPMIPSPYSLFAACLWLISPPPAIEHLRAARSQIHCADIRWTSRVGAGELRRYRFQLSRNGDRAFTRDPSAAEVEASHFADGPRQVMSWYLFDDDGTVWWRMEDSGVVTRFRDNPGMRMTMAETV